MQVFDIPIIQLQKASWNSNKMDQTMLAKLRSSVTRFAPLENLVARPLGGEAAAYEVLSGNQRLDLFRELGWETLPCVIVDLDDAEARLLAQALNHIHGEDDPGLRAELLRIVLTSIPESQVLNILPETAASLQELASLGQETIAEYLRKFQAAQPARLRHLTLQLTSAQLEVVEAALERFLTAAKEDLGGSPNLRGTALYLLCQKFLDQEEQS